MWNGKSQYSFVYRVKIYIYLLPLVFFIACFFPKYSGAQANGNKRIAVLELSNPAGLSKQEVTYLSDLIRQLASSKLAQEFLVMDKANILTLLPPDIDLETCVGQCAVETGRLLQAAYIITGDILRFGKQLRITVKVHDTRSGQLIGSEIASGKELMDMEKAIQEAGKKLLKRLINKSQPLSKRKMINEQTEKRASSTSKLLTVTLKSKPSGATIFVDGEENCTASVAKCKVKLTKGTHQIKMSKDRYIERDEEVQFSAANKVIEWILKSKIAMLEVNPIPKDLKYKIDDEVYQEAVKQEISLGKTYRVISADPCYASSGEEISTEQSGDTIKVNLKPKSLMTTLDLISHSQQGEPIEADVYVDGKKLGKTPGKFSVSVCSQTLRLSHPIYGDASQDLTLSKGQVEKINMQLQDSLTAQKKLFSTLMWSATALAITSFSVSLYGYFQASSIKDTYDPNDPNNDQEEFEHNKNLADLGVTGALVSGGAALLFYILMPDNEPQNQAGLSISKDRALATYIWRW